MAISADRFIAIQMPLRYEDLVTHRRVVTVAIIIRLFSTFLSAISVSLLPFNATFAFLIIVESIFFLATALLYYKIYLTIKRHKEQIQSQMQQLAENDEVANSARITKFAHGTCCIYLLFWVCYLPHLFISIARRIHGNQDVTIRVLCIFGNSCSTQFLPQSGRLLLENETDWTHDVGDTSKNVSMLHRRLTI